MSQDLRLTRTGCIFYFIWTASSETVPSNMRKLRIQIILRMREDHPGLCFSFVHSVISINYVSGQGRPWSDFADAPADLGLRCPHLPKDTFSHG